MFFVLLGVHCLTLVSTQKFLPKGFIHQKSYDKPADVKIDKPDISTRENLLLQDTANIRRYFLKRVTVNLMPLN